MALVVFAMPPQVLQTDLEVLTVRFAVGRLFRKQLAPGDDPISVYPTCRTRPEPVICWESWGCPR
jgi:hypothetical protein